MARPLWMDEDVAQFLHDLADLHYEGNVEKAMNESLRAVMIAMRTPEDPWAGVSWQARSRR